MRPDVVECSRTWAVTLEEPGPAGSFPTTLWSTILRARANEAPDAGECMNRVFAAYWRPVYALLRLEWNQSPDRASDLTQEFFLALLEHEFLKNIDPGKGRFRSFVRVALKHFMLNWLKSLRTVKRGGGARFVSFDATDLEERIAATEAGSSPEAFFEAQWQEGVWAEALRRLKTKLESQDQATAFEIFRLHDLEPAGPEAPSREALGSRFGMSPAAVKQALERARQGFRRCVVEVVGETVAHPSEIAEELRRLAGD